MSVTGAGPEPHRLLATTTESVGQRPDGIVPLLGAVVLVAATVSLQWRSGLNPDVAFFVEVARRAREGTPLYLDAPGSFVEVNPPLVIWLLMPAIWLARRLGLAIVAAPGLLLTAEALIGIGLSTALVWRGAKDARRLPWLIAIAGLLLPAHDFAQREHQVVLLLAPALVALIVAPTGGGRPLWLRVAVGLSAGLGLSLKPHFVIAWILGELTVAWLDRRPRQLLRAENCIAVGFMSMYAVAVVLVVPGYLRLMRVWGPPYLALGSKPIADVLLYPESIAALLMLLLALGIRKAGVRQRSSLVFAIMGATFLGAVVIQHKGFNYHFFPAFAFSCVALLSIIAALGELEMHRIFRLSIVVLSLGMFTLVGGRVLVALVLGQEYRRLGEAYASELQRHRASARGDEQFVVLSTSLPHAFPMSTLLGNRWPVRFPSLWALETTTPYACGPARPRDAGIERRFTDDLWQDLARAQPPVIIAAPLPPTMHPHAGCATVVDHLSRDPRFSDFFTRYVAVDTIPRGVYGPFVVLARSATY